MRQLRGFAMSPRSNGDPTPDPVPRAGQSAPPGGLGGGGISRQPQAHQRMAYATASRVRCAGLRPPWTRRRAAIIEPRRHTGGWVCDTEPDFDGRLFTATYADIRGRGPNGGNRLIAVGQRSFFQLPLSTRAGVQREGAREYPSARKGTDVRHTSVEDVENVVR